MTTRYDTPDATGGAPHVRRDFDLRRTMHAVVAALAPCLVFGIYNTGYQAHAALARAGLSEHAGWRGSLLAWSGVEPDASSVLACVAHGALYVLPLLAVAALTADGCQRAFAQIRGRALLPGTAVTVVVYTLCLPATLPWWQALCGMAFAIVVGREVFGGVGRNFANPALVGLAFLYFAFPAEMRGDAAWIPVEGAAVTPAIRQAALGGTAALEGSAQTWLGLALGRVPGAIGCTSAVACLLGGAWLLARRLASWRIVAGILVGSAVTATLLGPSEALPFSTVPWHWHVVLGAFAFGALFMATDPVSAAATDAGRWVYGLLIGFLAIAIRVGSPVHAEGMLLAILLGNLFAPLIDHAVVRAAVRRRRRRRA